jgi:hypothetical protein
MMTSLEALVSRFRRTGRDRSLRRAQVELEVRYGRVPLPVFAALHEALAGGELGARPAALFRTVEAVGHESQKRREEHFDAEGRKESRYVRKSRLVPPHRAGRGALSYRVHLSSEEPVPPFSLDPRAVVRVKSRAAFELELEGHPWRADLTVVRQLEGSEAKSALRPTIDRLFYRSGLKAENLVRKLELEEAPGGLYVYEVELEYRGKGDEKPLAAADVDRAGRALLRLARPGYMREAVYQEEVFYAAGHIVEASGLLRRFEREWGLKQLLPQVRGPTRADYAEMYPPVNYYLSDKAHGDRALAVVREGRLALLARDLHEFYAPGVGQPATEGGRAAPARLPPDLVRPPTIVDGELVAPPEGAESEAAPGTFYAFDVVAYRGERLAAKGFEVRVGRLADAAALLARFGLRAEAKPFTHLASSDPAALEAQFRQTRERPGRSYGVDGLILVEPDKTYADTRTYKWKPAGELTIDFLVRRPPRPPADYGVRLGEGKELLLLFVGVSPTMYEALGLAPCPGYEKLFPARQRQAAYFPIQFQPSDAPLAYLWVCPAGTAERVEGRVAELRCAGGCRAAGGSAEPPEWELVRVREDRQRDLQTGRYYGNDFRAAELTWLNYVDPFTFEMLSQGPGPAYFAEPSSGFYRAQRAFVSYVKSELIRALAHSAWVVDLGAGKGQDLGRYWEARVGSLVAVDRDRGALAELVRRKYSHARRGTRRAASGRGPAVHVLAGDIAVEPAALARRVRAVPGFPAEGGVALVANLVVHYLAASAAAIDRFAGLCQALVRPGGAVVLTTIFGQRLHERLQPLEPRERWELRERDAVKFAAERRFTSDAFTAAGQKVGVLLPFSQGEYYEEYLVNVDTFTAAFQRRGFECEDAPLFSEWLPDFRTRNPEMHDQLSEADREWVGLFGVMRFRRKKEGENS